MTTASAMLWTDEALWRGRTCSLRPRRLAAGAAGTGSAPGCDRLGTSRPGPSGPSGRPEGRARPWRVAGSDGAEGRERGILSSVTLRAPPGDQERWAGVSGLWQLSDGNDLPVGLEVDRLLTSLLDAVDGDPILVADPEPGGRRDRPVPGHDLESRGIGEAGGRATRPGLRP